jgi:hypothetical protein
MYDQPKWSLGATKADYLYRRFKTKGEAREVLQELKQSKLKVKNIHLISEETSLSERKLSVEVVH